MELNDIMNFEEAGKRLSAITEKWNNTNWEDVEVSAVLVPADSDQDVSKHEEWMNNDKEIIEK